MYKGGKDKTNIRALEVWNERIKNMWLT